jgi:Uma2 family endonuclease
MDWKEVTENPNLRDLPFKIELNEHGQIVMTSTNNQTSFLKSKIALTFNRNIGRIGISCPIWTSKGTKVADVAWISDVLWKKLKGKTEADIAPEICVEILSMSNSDYEMKEKRKLYFEQGAKEFWICDEYGNVSFYNSKRKLTKSKMFPEFPIKVEI